MRGLGSARMPAVTMVFAVLVVLVASACGTRVEGGVDNRQGVGAGAAPSESASVSAPAATEEGSAVAPVPAPAGAQGPASSVKPAGGTGAPVGSAASKGVSGAAASGPSAAAPLARSTPAGDVGAPSAPNPDSGGGPASGGPQAPAGRSPAVVASVGTYSGVVGEAIRALLQGTQMWVKYINDKGGVNGHKVKFLVYDDGGDPARHRAQVQEAVERQKVIAFLLNGEALTGESSVEYINSKRVPVVGTTSAEYFGFYTSPMYFPQQSTGRAWDRTAGPAVARQVVPQGKRKLGTLVCVEAAQCDGLDQATASSAQSEGFEHVYRGRSSVAQPDYTAECLAARNAGTEVFYLILIPSSVARVSTACARQGYHPTYAVLAPGVLDRQKDDPKLEGMVASANVFPYFQSGTPATDEFQQVLRSVKGVDIGPGTAIGWSAGKLFEKAAAHLAEPPTTESLLDGLWSIQGDTLGGLTPPLTFVRDQPAKMFFCWFAIAIMNKTWVSPDGLQLHCL